MTPETARAALAQPAPHRRRHVTAAIIGIDPGGSETGIVVRDRDSYVDHTVVRRDPGETMASYLGRVIDTAATLKAGPDHAGRRVAVEDLNPPNPHMGVTSVKGLLGTAQVLGAVLHHWPAAVLVPPGRHGSGPFAAYPEALRPTRGQGRGHDLLRHCRSAWDVAAAGAHLRRLDLSNKETHTP